MNIFDSEDFQKLEMTQIKGGAVRVRPKKDEGGSSNANCPCTYSGNCVANCGG